MVNNSAATATTSPRRGWSQAEHARYLEALELFPNAPWRVLAEHVGTRSTRQVMTHASKIALREQRHARGLKAAGRRRRASDDGSCSPTTSAVRRERRTQRQAAWRATEDDSAVWSGFVGLLTGIQEPSAGVADTSVYGALFPTPFDSPDIVSDDSVFVGNSLVGSIADWDELESLVAV